MSESARYDNPSIEEPKYRTYELPGSGDVVRVWEVVGHYVRKLYPDGTKVWVDEDEVVTCFTDGTRISEPSKSIG